PMPMSSSSQRRLSVVVAVASGAVIPLSGAHPTGVGGVDLLGTWALAAVAVWLGRLAPWWLVGCVAAIAAGLGSGTTGVVCGLAALVITVFVAVSTGRWAPPQEPVLALAVALLLVSLSHGRTWGGFGVSALTGVGLTAMVVIGGVVRHPRRSRLGLLLIGAASVVLLILAATALSLSRVRDQLVEGNRAARSGLALVTSGEMARASSDIALAARQFAEVDDAASRPWVRLSGLLPVVGQHVRLLDSLADTASTALAEASTALQEIDPNRLRVVDGRIDIAAIEELASPFGRLRDAVAEVRDVAGGRDLGPWIAPQVVRRLDDLARELDGRLQSADTALRALEVAPDMLGRSGPRRYFIAFTTPGEARGLGGFLGNWAEVTVDDGRLRLTDFGRKEDLVAMTTTPPRLTGMDELLDHWGRFGFSSGDDGAASEHVWANLTMPPDMPTVGEAVSQIYPQVTGRPVDTVVVLDSAAMGAILSITGPLDIEGALELITPANVAEFIRLGQYEQQDYDARVDLLDEIAEQAMERLLSSTLPAPAELGALFGPLVRDLHLMAWSAADDEQSFLEKIRIDGAFPRLGGGDGFAVTVDNGSGNKIENFLTTEITYDNLGQPDGERRIATIRLTNNAPTTGYPAYVIGNVIDKPVGWNRLWLSAYSARPMVSATLDGEALGMQTNRVWGWNVATKMVDIPPGTTVTVVLELWGPVDDPSLPLSTRTQPLTSPVTITPIST
ncbi:MAG: hypothetical protein RLZ04_2522, partial [Actinomycetota bacterium]